VSDTLVERPRGEEVKRWLTGKVVWADLHCCYPSVTSALGWCMSPCQTIQGVQWSLSFVGLHPFDHVASAQRPRHWEGGSPEQHTL
jgi:hypothetical protein